MIYLITLIFFFLIHLMVSKFLKIPYIKRKGFVQSLKERNKIFAFIILLLYGLALFIGITEVLMKPAEKQVFVLLFSIGAIVFVVEGIEEVIFKKSEKRYMESFISAIFFLTIAFLAYLGY
ncbi:hypothetical protein ACFYKX_02685 [Cytobacillus sp. FJAT-54145]|uniref:DUF4181 domain-containing protein n=1 Tax=Cytobacillus spartinae TaxID=3299023 RepID=A0ABW6K9A6_9BACI